ncbi:Rieske 2Fe-2S domain-containing protein [Bacteroides intestinalis]|uniref:Rieske 2Fe-2S domain-containing protein n=1 Tax=Bacteroides intestinalis TaxID=329854 RepID=UPI0032ED9A2D
MFFRNEISIVSNHGKCYCRDNICSHNATSLVGYNTLNLGQDGSSCNSHYHT